MNVFISHSAQSRIAPLRDLLKREGISFQDSFDPSKSSDILESIRVKLQTADAVIAVITREATNVFFEIGFAMALQKPVLVLLSPGVTLPSFAAPATYLTSDLSDSDVLRLGVRRFLEDSKKRILKVRQPRKEHVDAQHDGRVIQNLVERFHAVRQSARPLQVERLVADLLRAADITALEEYSEGRDRGVDFAVWSDSLRPSLGNPVLIEVKATKLNKMSFRAAYSRLAKQVQESDANAGLLLYLDKGGQRFGKPATWIPTVLWLDAEDFAKELLKKPFADVLLERRNRAVHGLDV